MNTFLLSALCLLGAWAALADGVTVQDGDFSFSLESVKKLKDLQEPRVGKFRRLESMPGKPVAPTLCNNQKFPEELKPLCKEPNSQDILHRLEVIAEDPSMCEICAYAACTGC
ncbi:guanylin [Carlito syrichta]|uniref:Guanylin n=1 Tax=Carlito syrichta TaxID=1868482 RepID=A0A1U7U9E3_CARSF|nr:guanylin [Carlito syrichta]